MEKDLNLSLLLDAYGELLTPRQRDSMDLYYNEDFSLTEIADHQNMTRQGVRDHIKRGESALLQLEDTLHLVALADAREAVLSHLLQLATSLATKDPLDPTPPEMMRIISGLLTEEPS